MKKGKNVEIELTEDWLTFKKGEVLTRSRDIASLHINDLKNAKPHVKPVKSTKEAKPKKSK